MPKSNNHSRQGIWGLRIPRKIQAKWRSLATLVNVPVSWLIDYVLADWLVNNVEIFGSGEREKLNKAILALRHEDEEPTVQTIKSDDNKYFRNLRTNISIRNVGMETRLKFKIMAGERKMPMNHLLDEIVSKEWANIENRPGSPGLSARVRKEVKKLFEEQVR